MGAKSQIEWTGSTWNPLTGCSKVSPGCINCYAERLSKRLKAMGQANYRNEFQLTLHEDALNLPLRWKKPQNIFVNSMSDLFHNEVPLEFIQKAFDVMGKASWHQFQVLTKRSERLLELNEYLTWSSNIWMGVSVENKYYIHRIDHLRKTNAKIKFISFEPLLGPIHEVDLDGIDWVIAGGESGPKSRPMNSEWVLEIRDHCTVRNIPFFFKQWGGVRKKQAGRLLHGQMYDEMPNINQDYPGKA
jgi:protein gp37